LRALIGKKIMLAAQSCRSRARASGDNRDIGKIFCHLRLNLKQASGRDDENASWKGLQTSVRTTEVTLCGMYVSSAAEMLTFLQNFGVRRHPKNKNPAELSEWKSFRASLRADNPATSKLHRRVI
jgi:hypothetical protein